MGIIRPPDPSGANKISSVTNLPTVYRVGEAGLVAKDGSNGATKHLSEDINTKTLSRSEGALLMFEQDQMNSGMFPGKIEMRIYFSTRASRSRSLKVVVVLVVVVVIFCKKV